MILFWVGFGVVLLFGFVLIYGAPYLPTLRRDADTALELLDLKPGQTMYELGCGDGRILRLAASKGLNVVGYELNPLLAAVAWLYTRRYRKQVRVVWGNFWQADLTKADGIFVFLLDRFMERLDQKIMAEKKRPVRLVSYAFKIPGKKIMKQQGAMFRYDYR
jgi:16S rRNA A1518/A1519 N6-dimethyltransferase RsmA/KsgA/DIM1 with predicted DNA glycosylase/AP lyase activity